MLFTVWLNLWTTRLVLNNLGVENMGVYNVVGSVVAMCSTFTGGVTSAVMRFLTFEMGKKDGNINLVFCSSINVIVISCGVLFILLETIGIIVFNNFLNIPDNIRNTAFWIYQLSAFTCLFNMFTIPYNALIIAHEKIDVFAIISIIQVVLSCLVAYSLAFFSNGRLMMYGILTTATALTIQLVYQIYCRIKLPESKYHKIFDWKQMRQIIKFTGISTTSGILNMVTSQGITLVINWTFGVVLNAVYAIALQLKNLVLSFAQNIFKAISPQITKTYAVGDYATHRKLVYTGSKAEVYMIFFLLIPFMFRTDIIARLWLGNVPEYAVAFMRCTIFLSLTYAAFEPIRTAVLATNKIARFMLIPDAFNLFVIPVAYIVARWSKMPDIMIFIIVIFEIFACALRVWYGTRVGEIAIHEMMREIFIPTITVALLSSVVCYGLAAITSETLWGLSILICANSIALCAVIYILGINKQERQAINNLILNKIRCRISK
ncbi:MAG: lipopolysaccharide biosynthesis protein [Prevotella sp.]